MKVNEEIKERRTKLGISQRELARKSGTTGQNISKIELGESNPSPKTKEKILNTLERLELLDNSKGYAQKIGGKIRQLRNENNLNRTQFADVILKSRQTIQKYEDGQIYPSIKTLKDIAELFNMKLIIEFEDKNNITNKRIQNFTTDELLIEIKRRTDNKENKI